VNNVDEALSAAASELMSAATSAATITPRTPAGITCCTSVG
jgi:hypothetical protein